MEQQLLLLFPETRMLDREKVVALLKRRFPGATEAQVAAAANAILGLDDEWIELPLPPDGSAHCRSGCYFERVLAGRDIKVLTRPFSH